MGICKKPTSVSFDECTRELVEKWRVKHAPLLDSSFSAAVRFIVRQYDSFMEALLSRPEMMTAMVDTQQALLLSKYSQVPLRSAAERESVNLGATHPRQGIDSLKIDGFLGRKTPKNWSKDWTAESGRPV